MKNKTIKDIKILFIEVKLKIPKSFDNEMAIKEKLWIASRLRKMLQKPKLIIPKEKKLIQKKLSNFELECNLLTKTIIIRYRIQI